jgi:hypothetical protein
MTGTLKFENCNFNAAGREKNKINEFMYDFFL